MKCGRSGVQVIARTGALATVRRHRRASSLSWPGRSSQPGSADPRSRPYQDRPGTTDPGWSDSKRSPGYGIVGVMDDDLWCPDGHEARDPTPAGPSAALCSCGAGFSTRPGVQAACRAKAGVGTLVPAALREDAPGDVGTPPARRAQPADDAPRALLLVAWPDPGPRAILSTPPRHDPEGDQEHLERAPGDDLDPARLERRSERIHPPGQGASARKEPGER